MTRIVYFGSPALAVTPLQALVDAGHEVVGVISQPDAKRGRGGERSPSPVKQRALDLGIAVFDDPEVAGELGADLGVVVAYGKLLSPRLVAALPMVNLHFSKLPRWRGAAPVERAILAGDADTGVCVMAIEEGLDTGGVYASATVPIAELSLEALQTTLVAAGTDLLIQLLLGGVATLGEPVPQVGEATYAKKISPHEHHLDFEGSAVELSRIIRLGRAWTTDGDRRLRIVEARAVAGAWAPGELHGTLVGTSEGALELLTVQPEGKVPMPAHAWALGRRATSRLGALAT